MPVFNEQDWIGRSIAAVRTALEIADWQAEIVVVDDGSTDDTPKRLAELSQQFDLTVVSQDNRGRFAARLAGIGRARGDQVLLLDSRVLVDPHSLSYLREQLAGHPDRSVWNGHVSVESGPGPYGDFWAGLVSVAWRRYFANPRFVSFGAEEFDRYPKGTGFFCAPRELLVQAADSFSSLFADPRFASDDTRMLRWIAERHRIQLSPHFSATYASRDSFPKFVRHSYFRGTTFVDSYLDAPGPTRRAAATAAVAGLLGVGLLLKRPARALLTGAAVSVVAGAVVRSSGGTAAQSRAVAGLLPLFAACFGSGVLRGLALAAGKALLR